ncbi:MAG TPA: hypothetical protein VF748_07950, partial [Candidatus Acidoferrum sp.]
VLGRRVQPEQIMRGPPQRLGVGAPLCQECMARPRGARRISESDERESCINVSGLFVEHLLLRTIMGIRAHPG